MIENFILKLVIFLIFKSIKNCLNYLVKNPIFILKMHLKLKIIYWLKTFCLKYFEMEKVIFESIIHALKKYFYSFEYIV